MSQSDLSAAKLAKMEYLNAVLNEGLRVYPPALLAMPRVVPEGGSTILGTFIPGGTVVGFQGYAATHSTRNFKLPNSFIPERWLNEEKFSCLG
ncbi:cytochrome P450 [Leptodontidium sp. MPI-SDFR-AT-0119]|nr:cytochrome P450 [Leptodontidium sp. MPI-SDFR-AT-0119]